MKHIIVGTAGHIDHGKTALIKALTGTDADRLKEEQQRGITIDIGFAFLALSDDVELGIIDVPGHEKFVKNMLAGVGGIDLTILVIAADEGIMPQTEEHLAICDLLQIQRGLVALTKTDLVEQEWTDMVVEDVREGLAGTFLQDAPIIPVSSKTGDGLDILRQELVKLADQVQARSSDGMLRLPVDRVFTIKGFGTVATGTLISGSVSPDDVVEILPEQLKTRVRNVQVHDAPTERAYAGQRTALNLHGLETTSLQRGCVVSEPGLLTPTYMLDAYLTLTPKVSKPLQYRSRVRFHHGTNESMARVIFFDREELLPGESTYVQFRLEAPLVALARDRYIIRSYSPIITIGGGEILHIHPEKHKRSSNIIAQLERLQNGSLAEVLEQYVEEARLAPITARIISGKLAVSEPEIRHELEQLVQQKRLINTSNSELAVIHSSQHQHVIDRLLKELQNFHTAFPLQIGMSKEVLRKKLPETLPPGLFQQILAEQAAAGSIQVEQNRVRSSSYRLQLSSEQQEIQQNLEQMYQAAGFQPPSRKEMLKQSGGNEQETQDIFQLLLDHGTLVRIDEDIYYHKNVLDKIVQTVRDYLHQHQEISIGDVKNLFGTSRKYTVPLMTYMDASNITVRKGDVRVLRETGSVKTSH